MQRFDFPNREGRLLQALLESPPGDAIAYAVFAHCFTCSKESRAAKRIAEALAARRIAVLRFDFTGLGSSEGDFADTDFSSNVDDLIAAGDAIVSERMCGPPKCEPAPSSTNFSVACKAKSAPPRRCAAPIRKPKSR